MCRRAAEDGLARGLRERDLVETPLRRVTTCSSAAGLRVSTPVSSAYTGFSSPSANSGSRSSCVFSPWMPVALVAWVGFCIP
jgi:hypothetical protein